MSTTALGGGYSDFAADPFHHQKQEMMMSSLYQPEAEFLCFCDTCSNLTALLDGFSSPEAEPTLLAGLPPPPDPDFSDDYSHPKRVRAYSSPFDGFSLMNPCPTAPEFLTEFVMSPPAAQKKADSGSLSAQSVAARQRRKKISEKTQELGTLIPGGNKMNTAEMFQAAFNYVKFMQAQVALLQFMASSSQEIQDTAAIEGLNSLLCSPRVQERLYEEGRCMVPEEFARTLAKDQRLRSNPSISNDLDGWQQSFR